MRVAFEAELWIWDARRSDSWTFVSLPTDASVEIRELVERMPPRGFGSVRVRVTIGASTWLTSIFPDTGRGTYTLPIKKAIRRTEGLSAGNVTTVTVETLHLDTDPPGPTADLTSPDLLGEDGAGSPSAGRPFESGHLPRQPAVRDGRP